MSKLAASSYARPSRDFKKAAVLSWNVPPGAGCIWPVAASISARDTPQNASSGSVSSKDIGANNSTQPRCSRPEGAYRGGGDAFRQLVGVGSGVEDHACGEAIAELVTHPCEV